jgi:lactoylglutathione lyase
MSTATQRTTPIVPAGRWVVDAPDAGSGHMLVGDKVRLSLDISAVKQDRPAPGGERSSGTIPGMATQQVHTCVRVLDPDASAAFYRVLGFEERGRLNFESAYNVYLGLPDEGDTLELTVNVGRTEPYDLGDGYNHVAVTVEDIDSVLAELAKVGVEPEKPAYHPGGREDLPRIAFVADPDGYRVELIDGGAFATPQDGPHPSLSS